MGTLKIFLVIFILSLSKKFLVRAEDGFLRALKPTSDLNGSIFDVKIAISSQIEKSDEENVLSHPLKTNIGGYRLKIIPFSKDGEEYIFVEIKNTTTDNLMEIPKDVAENFILSAAGRIILPKNSKTTINLNYYKTISNFLLFDCTTFDKVKKQGTRSFYTVNMPTIYGRCDVQSLWRQTDATSYSVEQFFDPTACSNYRAISFSDIDKIGSNYNLKLNNYRKFNLTVVKGAVVMNSLETSQQILWKPIYGKALSHELMTTYSFTFIEEAALSFDDTDFDFSNDKSLELLTSDGRQFSNEMSIPTLESMENLDSDILIKTVAAELGHIVDIWERHPINAKPNDGPMPWEVVKTTRILEFFEYENIVRLWTSLKGDTTEKGLNKLEMFYKLIPLSGSEGSVLFVKRLIVDGGISKELIDRMMSKLAGSIKNPTLTVLAALKDVAAESKSNSAVLAYTGAVGMAYRKNSTVEVVKFLKEVEEEMFSVLLDSSTSYKQQRLYIQALGNLGSVSLRDSRVVKLLSGYNDDIYLYCILALEKSTENPFEIMIRIISEGYRSSELKATALRIALLHIPSPKDFETLARLMDAQVNNELYNLFEAGVRALVKDKVLPESAKLWLRQRVPLKRSTAFVYHSPKDFPMAFSVRGAIFFNDITWALEQIYFSIYQNYNGKPVKMYTVLIRLIEAEKISTISGFGSIRTLMEAENLKYEFTFSRGSRVIMSTVESFNFKSLLNDLMELFMDFTLLPFKSDMGEVFQHLNLDYFFPTDAGKYAHLYYSIPWMVAAKFNSLKVAEKSIAMNIMASLNFTAQSVTGMYIYQPKLAVLQGTRESSSVQFTQQIALKVYKDTSIRKVNYVLELTDALTPLFGIRFRKFTSVHLNKIGISEGDGYPDGIKIIHYPNSRDEYSGELGLWHTEFGAKIHSQMNYVAPIGNKEFPTSLSEISYMKPFSEFFKNDGDFLVSLLSYINWNFMAYSAYTYNFMAIVEPCKVFPVKKYSLKEADRDSVLLELKDSEDRVEVSYKIGFMSKLFGVSVLRMVPGEESTMLCVSKLQDESNEATYHISYGVRQRKILECIEDQFQLTLRTKSDYSQEQILKHSDSGSTYMDCMHQSPYLQNWDPIINYRCAEAATSLRDMTINVNYKNAPKDFLRYLNQFWMWFLRTNNGREKENFANLEGPGDITIKAHFPMQSQSVNVDILLPDEKYAFTLPSDILYPKNIAFTGFSHLQEYFMPPPHCIVVASDAQRRTRDHYLPKFTDTWTEVAKINKVSVSAMKLPNDKLALKIDYNAESIEVHPNTNDYKETFKITVGENTLDELPLSWRNKKFHTISILDTLFITSDAEINDQTFVVGYNGRSVLIAGSNTGDINYGGCFGVHASKHRPMFL